MRLALDANRYVDFARRDPLALRRVQESERVTLPLIVLGELRAGFQHAGKRAENERRLAEFIREPRVDVIAPDEATTHLYARIYADLRAAGTPIPTNHLWIAALVLQHDLVLFTRDSHFQRIRQIATI